MKTFLIRLSLFFFLAIFVWIIGICVLGVAFRGILRKNLQYSSPRGYSLTRLQQADTIKKTNVLILGSSHAYRGFDPRIFKNKGIDIFNLGTSSQTPLQTDYLVDKYINKIDVKYVIYEVYYNNFQKDGLESSLDLIFSTAKPDMSMLQMLIKVDKIKAYNSFVYAYLRKSVLGKKEKLKVSKNAEAKADSYIPGGYVASTLDIEEGSPTGEAKKLTIHFLDMHKEAFETTIKKLQAKNIKVILVQAPVSRRDYLSITNPDYMNSYFSKFKGVSYYNFNNILPLPDTDFLDGSHLNQHGVDAFNNALIDKLKADGVLPAKF
jgi:hypothetical protein